MDLVLPSQGKQAAGPGPGLLCSCPPPAYKVPRACCRSVLLRQERCIKKLMLLSSWLEAKKKILCYCQLLFSTLDPVF